MPKQRSYTDQQIREIREEAFRAGYGMGGDAYQKERRQRPFLLEDEAWDAYANGQAPAPAIVLRVAA